MATEVEYVNYKDFVADLESTEAPGVDDVTVVSNSSDGPRTIPANTSALTNVATDSDLTADASFELQTATGKKKAPANLLAKQRGLETTNGNVTSLTTYVQNVAHSIAPAFDATRTIENPYIAGKDIVTYTDGFLYVFKNDHYGAWNAGDVIKINLKANAFVQFSTNPEFIYFIRDLEGKLLFGIRVDGTPEWQDGVPKPIRDAISVVNSAVYAELETKVDKEIGKSLINSTVAESQSTIDYGEFLKILLDKDGRVIEAIDFFGQHNFFGSVAFSGGVAWTTENLNQLATALRENGFSGGQGDWSEEKKLTIPMPKIAIVDFSGIESLPTTKTADSHAVMKFWDMGGNFFKKNVIVNAQGNSSLQFVKKNISIDICNDEWIGDDTFKLKIGDWVAQDSFHIKAYYTDFFRGVAVAGYNWYRSIVDTRGPKKNRTWKLANVEQSNENWGYGLGCDSSDYTARIDDGALCFPFGFPCIVTLNGQFYGIFSFQLKKHRDNYRMDKAEAKHIHLDGEIGVSSLFGGSIDWTKFEIRNPKDLYCIDGSKYDGDNPAEIVDEETAEAWISAGTLPGGTAITSKITKNLRRTYAVREYIETLSSKMPTVVASDDKITELTKTFNADNLIDYQIFCDTLGNGDGFLKNWQWTTWDGEHWFVNPYDLDLICGGVFAGQFLRAPRTSHYVWENQNPSYYTHHGLNTQLNARYKELRDSGALSVDNFINFVINWMETIGASYFKEEFKKWPSTPSNNEVAVNETYWEMVMVDGKPKIVTENANVWARDTDYSVDDVVHAVMNINQWQNGSNNWYYEFVCKQACRNVECGTFAYKDSIWRLYNWLKQNIENMDSIYNYGG